MQRRHTGGSCSLLVMRGQKRVEDARERAYDPRIHLLRKKVFTKRMDPRVKPAGDRTFAANAVVIAGLDPAIHPLRKKILTKRMDPRVKPAGDRTFMRHEAASTQTNIL